MDPTQPNLLMTEEASFSLASLRHLASGCCALTTEFASYVRVVHGQYRAWVQIAAATLSGNSLRQTVHTHRASVHQSAKLVAALLRVAGVTEGLAKSNGSLPPGL